MNHYENPAPRATFGIAAMAMAAIVIGLMVVLPARMTPGNREFRPLTMATNAAPVATEVVIIPSTITVTGMREQNTAFEPTHQAQPKG